MIVLNAFLPKLQSVYHRNWILVKTKFHCFFNAFICRLIVYIQTHSYGVGIAAIGSNPLEFITLQRYKTVSLNM